MPEFLKIKKLLRLKGEDFRTKCCIRLFPTAKPIPLTSWGEADTFIAGSREDEFTYQINFVSAKKLRDRGALATRMCRRVAEVISVFEKKIKMALFETEMKNLLIWCFLSRKWKIYNLVLFKPEMENL